MSKIWKRINRRGFTLVELLVVIAIIGILVSIVMPAITDALMRGKLTRVAANSRNLLQSLVGKETEDIYKFSSNIWPREEKFETSTDYFASLMTNEVVNVSPSFFAGAGVEAAPDIERFLEPEDNDKGYHNAWCIVGNISSRMSESMPVVFTRNLGKRDLGEDAPVSSRQQYVELVNLIDPGKSQYGEDDNEEIKKYFAGSPFDQKGFVFATKGGAAYALFKDDMDAENFVNLFQVDEEKAVDSEDKPLPILRPGA